MKFTLSWLRDFLQTEATLAEISDKLTAIGLEVEEIKNPGEALRPFTVAEILTAEQHPNADKLKLCKVNNGKATLDIVCGAPNARAGIKVALASVGSVIPTNGLKIKKSKIRGVESNGMLCSARELGLGEDHDGIIELPQQAEIGASIVDVLGLDDPVIEIAITPNRADCLGVYGIARDLAAAGLGLLKPAVPTSIPQGEDTVVKVHIKTDTCYQFVGCTIRGVKNRPSPEWMQQRLTAIGLRPISALVDVTNYITYSYGRPLHVYDVAKLRGDITVRTAQKGEKFLALNDKEYVLEDGMTVITDDSGVLGLGGIIGGHSSGCDENTTEVFVESALFDAVNIATTGRKLQIDSDARYRFERGVDPKSALYGAQLAVQMILELCGGTAGKFVTAGEIPKWQREIPLRPERINSLGGTDISPEQMQDILRSLGFAVNGNNVTPPPWRGDIEGEADLAEEILRIYGYDNITAVAMDKPQRVASSQLTPLQKRVATVRRSLAVRGLRECCSWSFLPRKYAEMFGGGQDALQLVNPISSELDTMRPSLLPNLLTAAQNNANRGYADVALFEIGAQFCGVSPADQQQAVAGIRCGMAQPRNIHGKQRPVDVFDAKADIFAALAACGFNPENAQIASDGNGDNIVPGWYHPGKSGVLQIGKNVLGYFGELHPSTLKGLGVEIDAVAGFELFLQSVPLAKTKSGKARAALALSDFPAVERDFAFLTDDCLPAAELINAVRRADKKLITAAEIFDVYAGKGVEDGKKSLALSVTLQASDRTLTDEEIEEVSKKIIAGAEKIGAKLRA